MVSATTSSYQAVTILALLIVAGLIVFFGIVYTQNQSKWAVMDTLQKAIKGPVAQLMIGNPNPGNQSSSQSILMRSLGGEDQLQIFSLVNEANKPFVVWANSKGQAQTALSSPPVV
jgi:hypothetical protein